METKLTLKLNEVVIVKAKVYARANNTSLSHLVENYLRKLTSDKKGKKTITPLIKSLSGVISLPKDHDDKKDYSDYLTKKYK